jgi:hypothetical protein
MTTPPLFMLTVSIAPLVAALNLGARGGKYFNRQESFYPPDQNNVARIVIPPYHGLANADLGLRWLVPRHCGPTGRPVEFNRPLWPAQGDPGDEPLMLVHCSEDPDAAAIVAQVNEIVEELRFLRCECRDYYTPPPKDTPIYGRLPGLRSNNSGCLKYSGLD